MLLKMRVLVTTLGRGHFIQVADSFVGLELMPICHRGGLLIVLKKPLVEVGREDCRQAIFDMGVYQENDRRT